MKAYKYFTNSNFFTKKQLNVFTKLSISEINKQVVIGSIIVEVKNHGSYCDYHVSPKLLSINESHYLELLAIYDSLLFIGTLPKECRDKVRNVNIFSNSKEAIASLRSQVYCINSTLIDNKPFYKIDIIENNPSIIDTINKIIDQLLRLKVICNIYDVSPINQTNDILSDLDIENIIEQFYVTNDKSISIADLKEIIFYNQLLIKRLSNLNNMLVRSTI